MKKYIVAAGLFLLMNSCLNNDFMEVYPKDQQTELTSFRSYAFRFHRSRDCHTNAKECGIAHDTGLRRRIGYPRCHLIGIFLFHTMSDLGR